MGNYINNNNKNLNNNVNKLSTKETIDEYYVKTLSEFNLNVENNNNKEIDILSNNYKINLDIDIIFKRNKNSNYNKTFSNLSNYYYSVVIYEDNLESLIELNYNCLEILKSNDNMEFVLSKKIKNFYHDISSRKILEIVAVKKSNLKYNNNNNSETKLKNNKNKQNLSCSSTNKINLVSSSTETEKLLYYKNIKKDKKFVKFLKIDFDNILFNCNNSNSFYFKDLNCNVLISIKLDKSLLKKASFELGFKILMPDNIKSNDLPNKIKSGGKYFLVIKKQDNHYLQNFENINSNYLDNNYLECVYKSELFNLYDKKYIYIKKFEFYFNEICTYNTSSPLILELFSYDRKMLIGTITTSIKTMSLDNVALYFNLSNNLINDIDNKIDCQIKIAELKSYIKIINKENIYTKLFNSNCDSKIPINILSNYAIDFTSSNGNYDLPISLHYIGDLISININKYNSDIEFSRENSNSILDNIHFNKDFSNIDYGLDIQNVKSIFNKCNKNKNMLNKNNKNKKILLSNKNLTFINNNQELENKISPVLKTGFTNENNSDDINNKNNISCISNENEKDNLNTCLNHIINKTLNYNKNPYQKLLLILTHVFNSFEYILNTNYNVSNCLLNNEYIGFGALCPDENLISKYKDNSILHIDISKFKMADYICLKEFNNLLEKYDLITDNSKVKLMFDKNKYTYNTNIYNYIDTIYKNTLPYLKFYGPTNLEPIIKRMVNKYLNVKKTNSQLEYNVVYIIIDNSPNDLNELNIALKNSCSYPISFIILGIGNSSFIDIEDSLNTLKNNNYFRNNVYFTKYNNKSNNFIEQHKLNVIITKGNDNNESVKDFDLSSYNSLDLTNCKITNSINKSASNIIQEEEIINNLRKVIIHHIAEYISQVS